MLEEFAGDDGIRVVVLSGAGGKAFVSGADISKFEDERAGAEAVAHYNATTARIYGKLYAFPKPTIAQITGSCVGGGVALAVCCDLRICGESSRFAIPAAKLGLGYGFAGLERLVNLIGPAFAKEMFFTARLFSAAEAYEMRLVNRVVPDDRVESYVAEYAQTITANAPLTVGSVKAIVGEVLKDREARDLAKCEELVRPVLCQPRLRRGAPGVSGEAPAPLHRSLKAAPPIHDRSALRAPPRSRPAPCPWSRAANP